MSRQQYINSLLSRLDNFHATPIRNQSLAPAHRLARSRLGIQPSPEPRAIALQHDNMRYDRPPMQYAHTYLATVPNAPTPLLSHPSPKIEKKIETKVDKKTKEKSYISKRQ
jgi:hypothetical protein